jgi:DNA polymerase delta subunit 1
MAAVVSSTNKRVLADSKAHGSNNILPSPNIAKRRKLEITPSPAAQLRKPNGVHGKTGSSQPKSHFEEEVLEKLTQDINGLKAKNSEKDQQWDRPGLDDFNPNEDALVFQQIEVEEGSLHGGRRAVKLFGVTEVCNHQESQRSGINRVSHRLGILFFYMSPISFTTSM